MLLKNSNFLKNNFKYLIYAEVTHVCSMWSSLALPSAQVTHVLYVDCLAFWSVRGGSIALEGFYSHLPIIH
jgi:hypothetical protein